MRSRGFPALLATLCLFAACVGPARANDLFDAVETGDAAAVQQILEKQPGLLNAADAAGRTPLHAAIAKKDVAVVETLLKHGADFHAKDAQGKTPVARAVESGSHKLALRFLLNIPDVDLTETVKRGDIDLVRLVLLGDPAEILGRPHYDRSEIYGAIVAALEHPQYGILKLLLTDQPDNPSNAKELKEIVTSRLCTAAWQGQTDLLLDYIRAGNSVNVLDDYSGTPLHQATCKGNLKLMRLLLDAGVDVNSAAKGWTALHAATSNGHRDAAEMLLAAGAKIDAAQPWGWRPIHNALWENHLDIAQLLLDRGAKIDACVAAGLGRTDEAVRLSKQPPDTPAVEGPPPVFWAARCGKLDTLKALWKDDSLARRELDYEFHRLDGTTMLHVAAEAGQTDVMRWLIKRGAPVHAATVMATREWMSNLTPLHLAAAAGQIEAVKVLLDAGENIEGTIGDDSPDKSATQYSGSPLMAAAIEGKKEMAVFLLDRGAKINAVASFRGTPLSLAAKHGQKEVFTLLLERETPLDGVPGGRPLFAAVEGGQLEMVRFLLDRGADVNAGASEGQSPLLAALSVRRGEWDVEREAILKLILDRRPSLKDIAPLRDEGLVSAAMKARNPEVLKAALEAGLLSRENKIDQLLIDAGGCGSVECMRLLLDAGLKLRSSKASKLWFNGMKTAFDGAVQSGHKDMVRFLIERGCNPNGDNAEGSQPTPLCRAAEARRLLTLLALLEAGADPNRSGRYSCKNALDIAAETGQLDAIRYLLAHGARFNRNGPGKNQAIYNAAYHGKTAALEFLLIFDGGRASPSAAIAVHTAAQQGHEEMLCRLIARGFDVNIKNENGRTPLHAVLDLSPCYSAAGASGLNKMASLLLELGADPNAVDNDGLTPLQIAIMRDQGDFAKKLIAKGAEVDVFSAAGLGQTERVATLLAADPKLIGKKHRQGPPLVWAARAGQTKTVRWLLDHGADVNAADNPKGYSSYSPLSAAVRCSDHALVKLLLDRGANINAPKEDALYVAIAAGRTEIVKLLLDRKAVLNRREYVPFPGYDPFCSSNLSPLHLAAGCGFAEITSLLLEHGADIEATDSQHRTPFDLVTAENPESMSNSYGRSAKELPPRRHDLVVSLLVDAYRKQDKKPPQSSLDKAVCWAARQGAAATVEKLLDAGANVNARGLYERTPLIEALYQFRYNSDIDRDRPERRVRYLAVVKLLMARGADSQLADRSGNAIQHAKEIKRAQDFMELLSKP